MAIATETIHFQSEKLNIAVGTNCHKAILTEVSVNNMLIVKLLCVPMLRQHQRIVAPFGMC